MSALPPLRALEAFRAVMRHGGFIAAARSLGLTPSAVSHRIRELERVLGSPLFERRNRTVVPTAAAHRYYEALQDGFDRLDAATRLVSQPRGSEILSLHCAPSFAAQWLLPRLKGFISAHPQYIVRLSSTPDAAQYGDEVYDLDIQYSRPVPAGCEAIPLAEEIITPMAAPDYIARNRAAFGAAKLDDLTLLHSLRNIVQWSAWCAEHTPGHALSQRGMQFDRAFMAIAAASDGLGVCLDSTLIAEQELASGRLIRAFPGRSLAAVGHRLVWRAKSAPTRKVEAFRSWIERELGPSRQRMQAGEVEAMSK